MEGRISLGIYLPDDVDVGNVNGNANANRACRPSMPWSDFQCDRQVGRVG